MTTLIVALDVPTPRAALGLVERLGDSCRFYKIGSELYTASGPEIVALVRERGAEVFLDLKFHDIPNTVRAAVQRASALGARLVTVHASGGSAMLRAAAEGAVNGTHVLAVTVLTSLDGAAVGQAWGRSDVDVASEVLRLAGLAEASGVHGVVCSGAEAERVRGRFAERLEILVPGVRLPGGVAHDQARVVTPRRAADAGATYIVVGRAITGDPDPVAAARRVVADMAAGPA